MLEGNRQVFQGFGPVPSPPQGQSAPEAEWSAARIISHLWHPGLPEPRCDCKQVVDACNSPPRTVMAKGGVHAGHAQEVLKGFGGQMRLAKVKAHRSEDEATSADDLVDILGNAAADAAAKAGALVHPRPSPSELREASRDWSFLGLLTAAATYLSSLWPPLRQQLGGKLIRLPRGQGPAVDSRSRLSQPPTTPTPLQRCHHFVAYGRHILCSACLCRARSWEGARRRERADRCSGVARPLE